MRKSGNRDGDLTSPKEWDFSGIDPEESEACLSYELARESIEFAKIADSYLNQVKTRSESKTATHCDMISINHRCAFLIESIAPHIDLQNTTWANIKPKKERAVAARAYRGRPAFDSAKREVASYAMAIQGKYSNARGVKEWDGANLFFQTEAEISLVYIDWTKPVATIKRDCQVWLQGKIEQREGHDITGRHAKSERVAQDILRGLSAMRLLAHHPLKEAIRIIQMKNEQDKSDGRNAPEFYPYQGWLDAVGRPQGQSAWDTGIKRTVAYFHEFFPLEKQGPRSWNLYQDRRNK